MRKKDVWFMRERRICGKGLAWLAFGLLFFLCIGIGVTAVEGKAAEGETETGELVRILDGQNMDEAGVVYKIDESSGKAVLRAIDWQYYEDIEGNIDIDVPENVEKGGQLYQVDSIDFDPNILITDPMHKYNPNDKIKERLIFYIGANIQKAKFRDLDASKLYCEVSVENENLYSFNGSVIDKNEKIFVHFYDGNYSNDDVYIIPEGITKIAVGAFHATKLKSIILPDSLTFIDREAFESSAITSIDLNCVEFIGEACFESCSYLEEVKISNRIRMGDFTFARDLSLKNIYIPSGSVIRPYDFYGCENLQTVLISNDTSMVQVVQTSEIFEKCPHIKTMILPDDCKEIPEMFLWGSYSLRKLYIPDSVEKINPLSFCGCRMTLYGKEGSVAADYSNGNQVVFQSIQNHEHKMEDVTFFSYDTWAVTGKYCRACGYGTEYGKADIQNKEDSKTLPPVLTYEDEIFDEVRRLDKNNEDSSYLVYTLNELTMTASVSDFHPSFNDGKLLNRKLSIPSKVIKNGKEYKVVEVLKFALVYAWSVRIPDTVIYLDENIFLRDGDYVDLGAGVEKINKKAFQKVYLKGITVSEQNPNFIYKDRTLFNKDQTRLLKYVDYRWGREEGRTYTIPDTVTQIDSGAFYGIEELDQINIYARGDLEIAEDAFEGCTASINYLDYTPPSGSETEPCTDRQLLDENNMDSRGFFYNLASGSGPTGVFYYAQLSGIDVERYKEETGNIDIWVPKEVEKEGIVYPVTEIYLAENGSPLNGYKKCPMNSLKGTMVVHIPDDISRVWFSEINSDKIYCESGIGNRKFISYNGSLYTRGLKTLWHCYDGDYEPEDEFIIPDTVTAIGSDAFYGTKLRKIKLPDSVQEISTSAFAYSSVSEINLEQVTEIRENAFEGTSISKVVFKEEVSLYPYSFKDCKDLCEVRFHKAVTIYESAFFLESGHPKTTFNVYIPEGSKVSKDAFCESNVEVVLIGRSDFQNGIAFQFCPKLKTLILSDTWSDLPSSFLCGAYALKKLYVPKDIKKVGEKSFWGCGIKLYGAEGSIVESYCDGQNATFCSLKDHVHKLSEVTFFSYDTWAVTGKYCNVCGYGTEYGVVDIKDEEDRKVLPPAISQEGELDENNTDLYGLVYKLNEDMMTASVTGIDKKTADESNPEYKVSVPPTVLKGNKCYTVTAIEDYALESAKSIYLPDSVNTVGLLGDLPNHTLDSLYLGSGVRKIDERNWEELRIKKIGVSSLNGYFGYDGRILYDKQKAVLLKFIEYGWEGEEECSYTIPDTIKKIGSGAFYKVKELEKIIINITDTGVEITPSAMEECSAEIVYNCTDKNIRVLNDENMDEAGFLYSCVPASMEATFLDIEWERYEHIEEDIEIQLPEKVLKDGQIYLVKRISLDPYSTMGEHNAYDINDKIKGKIILHIGTNIEKVCFFRINSSKLYCDVESDSKYLYSDRGSLFDKAGTTLIHFYDGNCTEEDIYQIPEGVTEIARYAFYGTRIKSVNIPDSVQEAGQYAFYNSAVSRIDLNQVTSVGGYCFADCKNLNEVKISKGLNIGWYAFAWNDLKNIYIPAGSKFSSYAFSRSSLQNVVIGSDCVVKDAGEAEAYEIFSFCSSIKTLILPYDLKMIPPTFLDGCSRIRKLYIPDSVESIGGGSFQACKMVLYGKEGSVAADYDAGRQVKFKSLQGHSHQLKDVTFFAYDTWAVMGKYCYECGYATEYGLVDLGMDMEKDELPELLIQKEEYSDQRVLDKDNMDDDYLVYRMDGEKGIASVTGLDITHTINRYIDIPAHVVKDGVRYTVESIEDFALSEATSIHMSDTIRKVGRLRLPKPTQTRNYVTIYLGAGVEEMDDATWENITVNNLEVSEKNQNYSFDGRVLYDKDKTKIFKYTDYKWGRDEERTYTVPDTVTWIGPNAFYNIKELDNIVIKRRDDLKISPTAFEDCTATIHYIDPEIPSTPVPEPTDEPEPTAEPTNTLNPDEPTVPTASPTIEPTDTPAPEEPSVPSASEPAPIPNDGSTPVPDLAMPTPIPVQNNISTSSSGIIPTAAPTGSENFNQELLAINGFHVKLTEKNYVSLSWSMNQYVSGYKIYRAKKKTGTYKMIKGLSETAVTYTDKKAGKNKTYYYKMEAFRTFPNKIVTGKRTSAGSVRIPAFTAPRIVIQKRKMGKIRFISIQFKKFKGKYADIYVAQGGKKFKKLKLVSSKIAKYKKKFKIQYKVKNKVLRIQIRTFDKKKEKKFYSSFSKVVKIKV